MYWNTLDFDDILYDYECVTSDFVCPVVTQGNVSIFLLFCDFGIVMCDCKWYVNERTE